MKSYILLPQLQNKAGRAMVTAKAKKIYKQIFKTYIKLSTGVQNNGQGPRDTRCTNTKMHKLIVTSKLFTSGKSYFLQFSY